MAAVFKCDKCSHIFREPPKERVHGKDLCPRCEARLDAWLNSGQGLGTPRAGRKATKDRWPHVMEVIGAHGFVTADLLCVLTKEPKRAAYFGLRWFEQTGYLVRDGFGGKFVRPTAAAESAAAE